MCTLRGVEWVLEENHTIAAQKCLPYLGMWINIVSGQRRMHLKNEGKMNYLSGFIPFLPDIMLFGTAEMPLLLNRDVIAL